MGTIIGSIMVLSFLVLIVFLFARERYFPKKPKGFRLLVKKMGHLEYYRIQVKRPFFGWTGFFVAMHSGKFFTCSGWSRDKKNELEYVEGYLNLRGLDPRDYQVTEKNITK